MYDRSPEAPARPGALSVSELTYQLKLVVERRFGRVAVEGEILNARPTSAGHLYFSLKDPRSTLPCVMWRSQAARLPMRVRDGMRVVAHGEVQVYLPHGKYQFIVDRIIEAGDGVLLARLEALRRRLHEEGLFDDARKQPLPLVPRRVGVVTAPNSAALRDILRTIHARYPADVLLYPARVQG